MASLLRLSPRLLLSPLLPSKTLIDKLQIPSVESRNLIILNSVLQIRSYISEMRKTAFENNIVRLLRNEISFGNQDIISKPVCQFKSYEIYDRPGEQWIALKRKFGEEDIKIEVSMFHGTAPSLKSKLVHMPNVKPRVTFVVAIRKAEGDNTLEFVCTAWPDTVQIHNVFVRRSDQLPARTYTGPAFKDMDDELQNALYSFLESRCIDDDFAVFMRAYMDNKVRIEYVHWMEIVKSFIEKKQERLAMHQNQTI